MQSFHDPTVRRLSRRCPRACPAPACPAAGAAEPKVVNVFNWSDYIDPKVLEDFTRETGIKVVYDTFDSNEMLETRLLAGKTGYDVVVPSATFLQRLIGAGVFQPLDYKKLPHATGLSPDITGDSQPMIPAIALPSITCGSRRASRTTRRRSPRVSVRNRWTHGMSSSSLIF